VPSEAAPIAIGLGLVLAVWVLLGVVLAVMNTILIVRRARGAALPWILVQAAIVMGMTVPLLMSTFGERLHLSDAMDFVVQFTLIGWPILYPFALMRGEVMDSTGPMLCRVAGRPLRMAP
jgi:uncharacterized membrane protein YhaH (DUF805 family)